MTTGVSSSTPHPSRIVARVTPGWAVGKVGATTRSRSDGTVPMMRSTIAAVGAMTRSALPST